ncbi:hypothetical protein [Streptomyces minutiscleroticus]|uniref:Uncharacterized protein n=1 Tax=Streptomyces minutiscleroticus TaxID=68238 RepID=A0A918NC99_9ACTN|nr:hypothetical protein [Streptomyces minutiscleroticus]GGX57166.1 hypothetical protein GCM10010358_09080 [Streptomyces minutiscleroticus]
MSLHDDLTSVQRSLDDLLRCVGRLEQQLGGGLEMRRVRTDADHLRESVALLREAAPGSRPAPPAAGQAGPAAPRRADLVPIPDTPYDSSLWTDSDDEGLGAHHRHAP